jgi:hypothetical protein
MIEICTDFLAVFIFMGCALGFLTYLAIEATHDGFLEEYLGSLALLGAFIWATSHIVGI